MEDEEEVARRQQILQWLQDVGANNPQPFVNVQDSLDDLITTAQMSFQFCDELDNSPRMRQLRNQLNYYERDCPRNEQALEQARTRIGLTYVTLLSGDRGMLGFRSGRLSDAVRHAAYPLSQLPISNLVREAQVTALAARARFQFLIAMLDRARQFAIGGQVEHPIPIYQAEEEGPGDYGEE